MPAILEVAFVAVVPSFNMGSSIASGMNDKDMQKEIDMKKPHMPTFVTHGKKMWGKKKPLSFDSACSQVSVEPAQDLNIGHS